MALTITSATSVSHRTEPSVKTAGFFTLGCRLNYSETSTLRRDFVNNGFIIRSFDQPCDVYIINTCSVTRDANRDCRKTVRKALRRNPDAFVVVTGCYAQLEPEAIAAIEGVDLVLGNEEKYDILQLAGNFEKCSETIVHRKDVNASAGFHHAFSTSDRTRVFLKVQDGCDYKCSFCTIPLARGKSRSPSSVRILEQAKRVLSEGYRELVLTGVNVGDFGKQTGESLLDLLYCLENLEFDFRLRISSIEPNLLTRAIIDFAQSSRILQPHFHIPLQSGSDEMLKWMSRRYNTQLYRKKIDLVKSQIADVCVGADVICGHPGETEKHFRETLDFLLSTEVDYLHVFTYSERPNTRSVNFSQTVDIPERKKRTSMLRKLSAQKRRRFHRSQIGKIRPVLFEERHEKEGTSGWTDNYIRITVQDTFPEPNSVRPCRLQAVHEEKVLAALADATLSSNQITESSDRPNEK